MKTRDEIVAEAKALNFLDGEAYEFFDARLYERAQALRGKPSDRIEWLLGWAAANVRVAVESLSDAIKDDKAHGENVMSAIASGADIYTKSEHAEDVRACEALYSVTRATLARVLETYAAMAVEVVS